MNTEKWLGNAKKSLSARVNRWVIVRLLVCGVLATLSISERPAHAQQFQNIVIVVQENRTPDNIFGSCPSCIPGADIATQATISTGQVVPLTCIPLASKKDVTHTHAMFEKMYDQGKLDGANKNSGTNSEGCGGYSAIRYVNQSDVQPYFDIATQYSFANRMFQTNQGPSFPAHQFLFGGTSAPTADSDLFAAESVTGGCLAPPQTYVALIDPEGNESSVAYPCFDHGTLTDLLDAAGLTWRYYAPNAANQWTAPNAIYHICEPGQKRGPACLGSDFQNDVILNPPQVLDDIASGNLANVSWVIPAGAYSDHAGGNNGLGPAWVASIVNAIGNSPYWSNTAVLITWDDWGGFYDHVPPPSPPQNGWCVSYCYGFRVPLMVVSASTPQGYVDNVYHDFGSILRFVENNWNLGLIGTGMYADAYADDLSEFFQGGQARPFAAIKAPQKDFSKMPLTDPDDY